MANTERHGFTFFTSYNEMMEPLTMENRGKLLTAMCQYFFKGEDNHESLLADNDATQNILLRALWAGIKPNLDTSIKRSHKGKAGAPTGNQNATKEKAQKGAKQSKNNQSPSENKKIIEESMIIEDNKSDYQYSLLKEIEEIWDGQPNNNLGKEEALDLQKRVSDFRDKHPKMYSEETYIGFLEYWSTPVEIGEYAGHCRYIEYRSSHHSFNVTERLRKWTTSFPKIKKS